jgi:hypothetical protein
MQLLRSLSTVLVVSAAVHASVACSSKDDRSLGNPAGSAGRDAGGGTGGSSAIVFSGGASGMATTGGTSDTGATGGSGGSGPENAGAAGEDGSMACTFNGLGTCGGASLEAERRTVNMLLVIDKSGSMTDPIGNEDKWTALKSALATSLGRVQDEMSFGLELFPYSLTETIPVDNCTDCCVVPDGDAAVVVPVAPGGQALSDISQQLEDTSPGGGTPTAKALLGALAYFTTGAGAALQGDKYVLLATDGGPNCNATLTCTTDTCTTNLDGTDCNGNCCRYSDAHDQCLDNMAVGTAIDDLYKAGIPTFVVGLPGTAQYAKFLNDFADAGHVPNTTGDTDYYAVSDTQGVQGLIDVFDTITTELVRSCDIPLREPPAKPELVNVAIDCNVVAPMSDDGSGWHFDDPAAPTQVVLVGPVCDALQANGAKRVDVIFGCPTVR